MCELCFQVRPYRLIPCPTHPCPVCCVQVTAKDYLETALLPVPGTGDSVNAKNGIRASIKALFPDR